MCAARYKVRAGISAARSFPAARREYRLPGDDVTDRRFSTECGDLTRTSLFRFSLTAIRNLEVRRKPPRKRPKGASAMTHEMTSERIAAGCCAGPYVFLCRHGRGRLASVGSALQVQERSETSAERPSLRFRGHSAKTA